MFCLLWISVLRFVFRRSVSVALDQGYAIHGPQLSIATFFPPLDTPISYQLFATQEHHHVSTSQNEQQQQLSIFIAFLEGYPPPEGIK
jgi:hypothetical protein